MVLTKFSDYLIPLLLAGAALYALCRRVDVFSALTTGAGEGLSVVLRILPPLVALLAMYIGFCTFRVPGMILFPIALLFIKQLHDNDYLRLWK